MMCRFGLTMKKFLLLLLTLTHLAFGQEIVEFKTGVTSEYCGGYCFSELTISVNDADYTLYGWDENDPVYLPVAINDIVDFMVWEDLNTQFNFELFMDLDSIIGWPYSDDVSVEWFEIATNDTVKRVTIEYGDSLNGLNNYINILRTIRQSFEEIQACYFIPNVGPCDADIPRYYYDQEENQCMEFTWGGCGGVVPFETLEDCESNCINDGQKLSNDIFQYPAKYNLNNCYPNPFNPITTLRYDLPENAMVSITIYDMMGRSIRSLVNSKQTAGYRSIQWDATNNLGEPVSAGMYIYMIQAGEYRKTKKMVLLK